MVDLTKVEIAASRITLDVREEGNHTLFDVTTPVASYRAVVPFLLDKKTKFEHNIRNEFLRRIQLNFDGRRTYGKADVFFEDSDHLCNIGSRVIVFSETKVALKPLRDEAVKSYDLVIPCVTGKIIVSRKGTRNGRFIQRLIVGGYEATVSTPWDLCDVYDLSLHEAKEKTVKVKINALTAEAEFVSTQSALISINMDTKTAVLQYTNIVKFRELPFSDACS